MLTQVTVVPPTGAYWPPLTIPVLAPDNSGIFIEHIDGLEPVQAEIATNSYEELDGEFYVGGRVGKRNIVLHMLLEPGRDQSVSDLRRKLYGYFMPKLSVTLQFDFTDRDSVNISGYAEDYQGDRFSQDPNAQVSIICPMPNFQAIAPVVVSGVSSYDVEPPWYDVLNDGDQTVGMQLRIVNDSADETDFNGSLIIERTIESPPGEFYNDSFYRYMYVHNVMVYSSSYGYYTWVDTNPGKKEITSRDGGNNDQINQNFLGGMADDSTWLSFFPALNKFRLLTTDTTDWAGHHLNFELTIIPQFGAI